MSVRNNGKLCWVEIRGHYPEDSADIVKRVEGILHDYIRSDAPSVTEVKPALIRVFFDGSMPSAQSLQYLWKIEQHIKASFAPSNKITVSLEIP